MADLGYKRVHAATD